MKIVMSGATGFIGKKLTEEFLEGGHSLTLLSRRENPSVPAGIQTRVWDARTLGPWSASIDGADAVINLTGEPIAAKRWTAGQKKKIRESRVDSTRAIAQAIQKAAVKPKVWVNASAVGYYGAVENGDVTEVSPRGTGFLAETCEAWEKETVPAQSMTRVVLLRTGVVLERDGGALSKMEFPLLKKGAGCVSSLYCSWMDSICVSVSS